MKPRSLILALALVGATALSTMAQPVSPGDPANPVTNTIAYPPGWSLIANPLAHSRGEFASNAVPDNSVGELFSDAPDGLVLLKFDNITQRFEHRNVFHHGQWSNPAQTLTPGEGAYLFNPLRSPLEIAFTGNWPNGSILIPSGKSLISCPGPGTIDFSPPQTSGSIPPAPNGTLFNPQEGDTVYTFAGRRGALEKHHFHNGAWDNIPVVDVGESFFVFTSHPRVIYSGPLPL
jgi:hypothetical protein